MNAPSDDPPLGGTIDRIHALLPSLNPGAQRAARICVDRADDVLAMTGADLAEAAGTSPATVSRMAKALGFRSFQHLRIMLVRDLGASPSQAPEGRPDDTAGRLKWLAESAAGVLQTSLASVGPGEFDAAVAAIVAAPRLVLVGTGASGPPVQTGALAFALNGRSCEAPLDGVTQQLVASTLQAGDVCLAVSASGTNAVTNSAARAARDAGASVIGVTSFAKSALAEHVDLLLVAGARFLAWDPGSLGSALAQTLLLSALQMAVAERMSDVAARARDAVRDETLDLVEETASADDDDADAETAAAPAPRD